MTSAPFPELATCLKGDQPPRVWSLLVTLFGELAQAPDARISGALIRHLSALIGIKPEAVRVALHRLRKEGWTLSQRRGRTSDYGLTEWGRAQCAAASPLIYGTAPLAERAWLVIFEPGHEAAEARPGALWLTANLLVTSHLPDGDAGFAMPLSPDTPLPGWMTRRFCDESTAALSRTLLQAVRQMDALGVTQNGMAGLTPCERAALRMLVVHDWRRIVLKLPALPDFVFPPEIPVARCRAAALRFLKRIPKEEVSCLEHAIAV